MAHAPSLLRHFRESIPFFKDIPDDVYFGLDPGEWHLPSGDTEIARQELEEGLQAHVMTYRRGIFLKDVPAAHHLCAHLAGADLDDSQKKVLDSYEDRFFDQGVSFVAYAKPLVFMYPERSSLHAYQRSMQRDTQRSFTS